MVSLRSRTRVMALPALFAMGLAMVAGLAGSMSVRAQDAPPLPAGCAVVASGLFNPRDIAVDTDGTLYIAEAGDAGENIAYAPAGEGTPEASEVLSAYGPTGQVTKVAPDGTQSVLRAQLPSYTFGTEVVGPSGITVANGVVYLTIGGPGPGTAIVPALPNRDSVVAINPESGVLTTVAHIGAYERSTNPDPNAIDSNLGGIAAGADGMLYVADAGGNTIYKVAPTTFALSVFAVIPGLPTPDGSANPDRGGAPEVDPVPTDVAPAPDGGVYVSLLTGGILWGTPGAAKILHIAPDGTITDAVTGLNLAVSVATGPDGTIYASQLSENFFAQPPAAGVVGMAAMGGAPSAAVSGLFLPYGVAIGPDGAIYVVTNTTAPAGTPAGGQVLKCEAAAGGGAEASPEAAAALSIDLVDTSFSPEMLSAPADAEIVLSVRNAGIAPHDFNIEELDIHTGMLAAGKAATVHFKAPAGAYTYYCNFPGHRQKGMFGTLTVS